MKPNFLHYSILLAAALLMAACSQSDLAPEAATSMTIKVTDSGFASAQTRAAETAFTTTFTAGDACGLYIVRDGQIVFGNVKLTATDAPDGSLSWQPEQAAAFDDLGFSDNNYFLYYPYRDDAYMAGKTTTAATTDADFFNALIAGWQVSADQSTHDKYTGSDLMTAKGTATRQGSVFSLSFAMTHRMALAVVSIPRTVYKFTDTKLDDYIVIPCLSFDADSMQPYLADDGTLRCVYNPRNSTKVAGSYDNGQKVFDIDIKNIPAGSYRTYVVDNAAVVTKSHNLQIGDYILADGNLLPKDADAATLSAADVAGIVFWSPSETDVTGRVNPARLSDDRIRMADYPSCTHGLAVAVKDAESSVWQKRPRQVAAFQASDNFTHPMKDQFYTIKVVVLIEDDISSKVLGYQNTQVIKAYNSQVDEIDYAVIPYYRIVTYANSYPAPATSTGWYLPSAKEFDMLVFKDDDVWRSSISSSDKDTYNIVSKSLQAIGGDRIGSDNSSNGSYWTSTEADAQEDAAIMNVYYSNVFLTSKWLTRRVRAVCAF